MFCNAAGCVYRTTGWSAYCSAHKSRCRRHGHPEQSGITKTALQPYVERLQAIRNKNPDNPLWHLLEERWEAFLGGCRARERGYRAGHVVQRNEAQAAREVVALAVDVQAADVIDVIAALVLMARWEPRRFCSDVALLHQVVRRVRALSETSIGSTYDHRSRKIRRLYRDLPPKTTRILGHWLVEAFGSLGQWAYGIEEEAAREAQEHTNAIHQAMKELR